MTNIFLYFVYLILFSSCLISDDIMIKQYRMMQMKAPFVGIVKSTFDQTISKGFYKEIEKVDAESWLASPFIDSETGIIIINGTDNIMRYDVEEKEYWIESLEEYFVDSDSSSSSENQIEDDTLSKSDTGKVSLPWFLSMRPSGMNRDLEPKIMNVNGFQTEKWVTTLLDSLDNPVAVYEEWFVDTLPLAIIFDSLKTGLMDTLNPYKEKKQAIKQQNMESFFSSNYILESLDLNNSFEPFKGYPIKFSMYIYEDGKEVMSMSFEIKELYATSFDASYFTVPEKYKRIKNTD
tara:strand:- start:1180 stop:2055 length:876 start_codon:yes stop_codon:yes gene_type:complete